MTHSPATDINLTVIDIEAALASHGVSVSRLCQRADVAFSTWHRWKKGERQPGRANWARVVVAFRELVPAATAEAAA